MTNIGEHEQREVVVRLTDVRKDFGDHAALDGVSLEIGAGESVAVMGPSGSGKSTLLNMVSGLDRPTGGSVVVGGEDLARLDEKGLALFRRRRIGMIFQFFNLLDDLPALDNVALAGQLVGMKAQAARARARELMGELGVADRGDVYPAALSGGERQRVATARALMNRPSLLLADEPTGALDSRSGDQVARLLTDLNRLGQTLLVVTHDPRLAAQCVRRVVEVADGRVARDRTLSGAAGAAGVAGVAGAVGATGESGAEAAEVAEAAETAR
uniref:ABC transporter ATP-binding protein n=1 Tax=Streptomyces sp. NBC_00049 TaxID=2903617 RepID=A0AAU2JKA5_9ACTN